MNLLNRAIRRTLGYNPLALERDRKAMLRSVRDYLEHMPQSTDGPEVVVVVAPWQDTDVPWFTLTVGLMMAQRGANVRFVLDDMMYGSDRRAHDSIVRALDSVLDIVKTRFDVRKLSDAQTKPLTDADHAEIERLNRLNATWSLRGEMPQEGRSEKIARDKAQNTAAQAHIAGLFDSISAPELVFTAGGVFGHSGLWMREARRVGARIGSFDAGGFQAMLLASDGMACQLRDIPRAFEALTRSFADDPESEAFALRRAEEELAKRRGGTDSFSSQIQGAGDGGSELDGGFLIALNSSWDAAALGPHTAFATNTDWIVGSVRWCLENTDRPVIVRQHPVERLPIARTSDDYGLILKREFGDHERLHFIAAADPVNSYALLEKVEAVLVHTSTMAMEAVAFGRPVITGSDSYYAKLGFVNFAATHAEFEQLLARADKGELPVTDEMIRNAKLCYYITQCCNWVFSEFNPANVHHWMSIPLAELADQTLVRRMIDALMTGEPVATLNHRAALTEAASSPETA